LEAIPLFKPADHETHTLSNTRES